MNLSLTQIGLGLLLVLIQALAAVPWVLAWNWQALTSRRPGAAGRGAGLAVPLLVALAVVVVGGVAAGFFLGTVGDRDSLAAWGRFYGALLEAQLTADLFVVVFAVLLAAWPKGGAVALAAFREGIRQPMFWLLALLGAGTLAVSPFIPYFTFGEDYKMVEEIGYDTIMVVSLLFATLAASMSISDEIEGRTAITLMSKPVSRRQFLLGKFAGILLAALVLTAGLGLLFDGLMLYTRWYDNADPVAVATPLADQMRAWAGSTNVPDLVRGIELWGHDAGRALPGLILGACQVMVLLAVAVSLATRLPMVINLVICLGVYFLGHLTPVLVQIAQQRAGPQAGGSPVAQMLSFMAQLFDTLLPALDFFSLGTSVVRDAPLPMGAFLAYVASVCFYGALYTTIVLVFGLILFEDRDLA
ncbi:MAG TPA: ABC transporter permease [Gemmataceae bacterium]|nr:ABC transporter permease [Gemmataceae bacterium]